MATLPRQRTARLMRAINIAIVLKSSANDQKTTNYHDDEKQVEEILQHYPPIRQRSPPHQILEDTNQAKQVL